MVNPLMGRFTFMPRFWHHNDASVVGTLEGMPGPSRETIFAANIAQSVRPGPFGSLQEQEQCVAVMLAALAQFKHVARSVVRKWCGKQPQGTMCSLDMVFDLVCANHQAGVPDQYYETLRLVDNTATDLDILSCSDIVRLYDRTAIQVHSKVDSRLNDNTVVTGAQSDHTDAPRPRRVRVAYTSVRR